MAPLTFASAACALRFLKLRDVGLHLRQLPLQILQFAIQFIRLQLQHRQDSLLMIDESRLLVAHRADFNDAGFRFGHGTGRVLDDLVYSG